MTPPLYL